MPCKHRILLSPDICLEVMGLTRSLLNWEIKVVERNGDPLCCISDTNVKVLRPTTEKQMKT